MNDKIKKNSQKIKWTAVNKIAREVLVKIDEEQSVMAGTLLNQHAIALLENLIVEIKETLNYEKFK
ncbi:hypothetical protein [Vibrio parahaemolyticus]|uniref:hypothetical protein n=1 Tax=Vibrio parahaemolyticus TaxID=670 RepID=UPI0022EAD7C5|nr:hypothetical protein [Vibrio parahaemolyticus]